MMSDIVGLLLGAELDRSDGGSGLKGAVEGYLIERAVKVVAPLVVTFAIGWGVQFLARRAVEAVGGGEVKGSSAA
jgi:uncharacterized membrane protein (Fun14 family)